METADALQLRTQVMFDAGMVALYCEFDPELGHREIYWSPTKEVEFEVRSGRSFDEFMDLHQAGVAAGRELLTLHVSSDQKFSAVWLSEAGIAETENVLAALGIMGGAVGE